MSKIRTHGLVVLLLILAAIPWTAAPSSAASLEVLVRDSDGRKIPHQRVRLRVEAVDDDRRIAWMSRGGALDGQTDARGRVTFDNLPPGTYVADVAAPRGTGLLPPSDNPLAPAPRVTLFGEQEHLETEIVLARGLLVTVLIELPDDAFLGFRAHFRHRESGRLLTSGFPRDRNLIERLLAPGIWEVSVQPRPGYLLVGVERDRQPLPGFVVSLDLAQEPSSPYLTWTYAAPSTLAGVVVEETGRAPAVVIEATLLEPGPWHAAARRRGGSLFERVTAGVDIRDGKYEMKLPDGVWSVRPMSSLLISSEPEVVDLQLAPGDVGRVDFTVQLDTAGSEKRFEVDVTDVRLEELPKAMVEVRAADDPTVILSSGTTDRWGTALLPGLSKGSYLVVAGHEDYLEGRLDLRDYDPDGPYQQVRVELPSGAKVRLQATDPKDQPLADVELTVERLGGPPETLLQAEAFIEAKRRRTAVTDQSGRTSVQGFYPGTYHARARLAGRQGVKGLVLLGLKGEKVQQELDFEIRGEETIELEAVMLPAASLDATLVCADGLVLPGAASARVVDGGEPRPGATTGGQGAGGDETGDEEAWRDLNIVLTLADVPLTGGARNELEVGPLEQGVYRLAVRPTGFDRWTWAFETHDPTDSTEIQTVVAANASGPIDLGDFLIECGPAVDLLGVVATGGDFPDVREVEVAVRVLDPEDDLEISSAPAISGSHGRILLRGLPRGPQRLEITLGHPHLLPEPTLTWRLPMELERGQFREAVLEIEALGGSIRIVATGGSAVLYPTRGEARRTALRAGETELPSLVPGSYRLELMDDSGDSPTRVYPELEVHAGETLRLDARVSPLPP